MYELLVKLSLLQEKISITQRSCRISVNGFPGKLSGV